MARQRARGYEPCNSSPSSKRRHDLKASDTSELPATLRWAVAGTLLLLVGFSGCSGSSVTSGTPADGGEPTAPSPHDDAADAGRPAAWVTVSAGRRYLTVDGAPFLVMGNQPGTGFLDLADADIDAHFARMQDDGETVARIDLDYGTLPADGQPGSYVGLESKIGVFDPARVARVDKVFDLAAAHGIRLLVVPFVTSPPMWGTWPWNPYGREQGGPANDPNDFLTSPGARAAFGARLEWIAARWGGTGTFFGWDLMNEAGVTIPSGKANGPAQLQAWAEEMAQRVAAKERALYGAEHLRLVSWASMVPETEEHFVFDSPALNVASTHPYDFYGTTMATLPHVVTSLTGPALAAHDKLGTILGQRIVDRRPYFEDEHHQNTETMLTFYEEADHQLAWAEIASGAAGTGITWLIVPPPGADYPHAGFAERHEALGPGRRALAEFVKNRVPSAFFSSPTADEARDPLATSTFGVAILGTRRDHDAIAWLVATDDRCQRVEGVDEIRSLRASHGVYNAAEGLVAIVLWSEILKAEGIAVDESVGAPVVAALQAKDYQATLAAEDPVFGYLEGIEMARGTLARLAPCPSFTPSVTLRMPPGRYRVDWIEDAGSTIVRSDTLESGTATVVAPSFTKHLAAVVVGL